MSVDKVVPLVLGVEALGGAEKGVAADIVIQLIGADGTELYQQACSREGVETRG
jgi:hypothetical protein